MMDINLFLVIEIIAFSVILKSVKLGLIEVGIVLIVFIGSGVPYLYTVIVILQFAIAFLTLFKVKVAIDRNYQLVLEKTHHLPAKLTRGGNSGSKSTFL